MLQRSRFFLAVSLAVKGYAEAKHRKHNPGNKKEKGVFVNPDHKSQNCIYPFVSSCALCICNSSTTSDLLNSITLLLPLFNLQQPV